MKKIKSIIRLLRIKQWVTKNGFVLAGIIFAGKLLDLDSWTKAGIAFAAFCAAASFIYVINDIVDKEADANHPVKCKRPIASGKIKISGAIVLACILLVIAIGLPFILPSLPLFYCIIGYIAMMILYTFYLKHVVILDVMIIAIGFLLRAVAGVVVLEVVISEWLILCTALLALFLGLNKRRGELEKLGSQANTRKVLSKYSMKSLDDMLAVITPSLVVSYALYTVNSPAGSIMLLTLPFVIYGLFRFIYIADVSNVHDAPDMALLKDMPLLIDVLLWVIVSAVIMLI